MMACRLQAETLLSVTGNRKTGMEELKMTKEMQKAIKERKAEAALVVRYANPKSKSKPTTEQVLEILKRHIPYCGTIRPAIEKFTVSKFNRNPIQRSVHFLVELDNGKKWDISVYENLRGRTPEEKEADKTATFPSGLFNIFHDEIKAPETEPEQVETEKIMDTVSEYAAIVDGMATEYTNAATVETVRAEHPELDFMDDEEIAELLEHATARRNTQA